MSCSPADARLSRKRVQLTNLDRKKICQLAVEHETLSQDKLTALLQNQLNKPEVVLMRLSKPHYCVRQGSSPKSWRCPWLAIRNSAPDEVLLQMLATKVSNRTVLRTNQSCQPNTSAKYFSQILFVKLNSHLICFICRSTSYTSHIASSPKEVSESN